MNELINYDYINNISDIISFLKEKEIYDIFINLGKSNISIKNNLVHKNNNISYEELFIFNLDNYISFIKRNLNIDDLKIRYILLLTLKNKYNIILQDKHYYYNNIDYFHKSFIKMFMYKYYQNYKFIKKFINLKKYTFDELINLLNTKKN